ncbi:hypothetical protein AB0H34_11085 [Saccharopolyspora shandongensis]|uniref:hypothetical protein n=1 Tax=Saccharopolyspora shandongensis TaxID=418495 RepID=UPI0033DC36EE
MSIDQTSADTPKTNDLGPSGVQLDQIKPAWDAITSWLAGTKAIPHDVDAVLERYGVFQDEENLARFLAALEIVRVWGDLLGSPASLTARIAENPNYITGPEVPEELYAAVVRLTIRVENTAGTVVTTYDSLPTLLDPAHGTAKERADALKQVLRGENRGLTKTIDQLATDSADLRARLTALQKELASSVVTLTTTSPLNEANRTIGALRAEIETLHQQTATPETEKRIRECEAEISKKESLVHALHDVFSTAHKVTPKLIEVCGVLEYLGGVVRSAKTTINMVCGLSSDEQLGTADWVKKALGNASMRTQWQELQDKARAFVQHAQVTP